MIQKISTCCFAFVYSIGLLQLLPGVSLADESATQGSIAEEQGAEEPIVKERTLRPNRNWEVLDIAGEPVEEKAQRDALAKAARGLGRNAVHVAGAKVDAGVLMRLANVDAGEPLLRAARESLGLPVDLLDLLYFVDDVLRSGEFDRSDEPIWLTPGRARKAGVLLHPDDVFEPKRPRRYGVGGGRISLDAPKPQKFYPPAADGELLGPNWTMRFPNPEDEDGMMASLAAIPDSADFAHRVRHLVNQLRDQGATVRVESTVRSPKRGYLMWGAFNLARAKSKRDFGGRLGRVEAANLNWELDVPILWVHPEGWEAGREAAREMADTYGVVHATERGARSSDHYRGAAIDLVAVDLPRRLSLRPVGAQEGATSTEFDLSDPEASRDLSLSPELIQWVEQNLGFEKLEADYPHWGDASRK